MPVAVLMPALSPTMKEGHLARWHRHEGERIAPGDVMADIETDKATMEVEAVDEGILGRIVVPAGTENVPVNATIAWLLLEGETADNLPSSEVCGPQEAPAGVSGPAAAAPCAVPGAPAVPEKTAKPGQRIAASPLARRLAEQHGIALESLVGTGPHGRIIRADVEEARAAPVVPDHPRTAGSSVLDEEGLSPWTLVPHSTMRKVIARRLSESKQTVPHFYLSLACELDDLLRLRQEINTSFEDLKISVNDFVIRACALALQQVPEANAGWTAEGMRRFSASDIAVAVALEGGLITPIVRSAEKKTVRDTSQEMKDLVARARQNKLRPEEFTGGTFSVSNLGMYGIRQFQAIVNPPQACILAVGAGEQTPVVKAGQIVAATVMQATLSVDHRVVDGVVGARFLQAFRDLVQTPLRLVV